MVVLRVNSIKFSSSHCCFIWSHFIKHVPFHFVSFNSNSLHSALFLILPSLRYFYLCYDITMIVTNFGTFEDSFPWFDNMTVWDMICDMIVFAFVSYWCIIVSYDTAWYESRWHIVLRIVLSWNTYISFNCSACIRMVWRCSTVLPTKVIRLRWSFSWTQEQILKLRWR